MVEQVKTDLELYRVGHINFVRIPTGEDYGDGMYFKVQDIALVKIGTNPSDCHIILNHGGTVSISNISPDGFIEWLVEVTHAVVISKGD